MKTTPHARKFTRLHLKSACYVHGIN